MVCSLFPCFAEGQGSRVWSTVAMAKGEAPEVGVSPLVRAFWEETDIELAASCTRLCWELPPRGVFRRRERGAIAHAITFVDDVAVHVPSLNTWDQLVWPLGAAMPRAAMEVEQYSYCHGQAVDLGPVMPATQFRVTDEGGTYLCVARALVFEGSVLAYNHARDEAEWVPARGVANDLSWVEEKSDMALANYVPRVDERFDDEQEEKEDEHEEAEGQGEASPKSPSGGTALKQGETEQEAEPRR